MRWTCLLFWPGLCYTHCHGSYRQLLLEMGATLTLRSRDVCWKTRQTSNRLDLATRAPAVFQCVGLEDAGTNVCVFFVNLNIRSNRIIRSNMKQVVLLRNEAFKGQYSILRGIWQIKTRFLGSSWVSKMRPCMHAVNQSTEVNTVGSRHHLIRNLGETERYIEVSYSSVAHKWMASFHLSWIDDFGGGNIISDQKEELLCSVPRFEPSKVGLCVRSWWHSTADRSPIRPIKPLCRISIIMSRVFSPVHDHILTIRFGWESLDQFPQQPWHHGRPDLGRKGRWEGQQGQDAKVKCMEDWCSEPRCMLMLVQNQNVCGVLVRPSSPKVQMVRRRPILHELHCLPAEGAHSNAAAKRKKVLDYSASRSLWVWVWSLRELLIWTLALAAVDGYFN